MKKAKANNELVLGADLETSVETTTTTNESTEINFSDIKFLETADPQDYATQENVTPKFDKERESKIMPGLEILSKIPGIVIDPLLILLAKWWEIKPARNAIKKDLIDKHAETEGYDGSIYMQMVWGPVVAEVKSLQTAIERLSYANNYYKPRNDSKKTMPKQRIKIGADTYEVFVLEFKAFAAENGDNKEALRNWVKENGTLEESTNMIEL